MRKWLLVLWIAFLAAGCASQKTGCPGSNFYSGANAKQNKRAKKHMDKLF
ncbi:hypothetical protein [uncultured Chitinophaga sp.]|nr:hypothetical protein [uncultured Chitinophaga sp.]